MKRTTTIIVCLLLAGSAAAGLPTIGFAVKGGGHWVEDPRETSRSLQACYEIEIESPAFWGGHVTLVGGFNGTNLDNERDRQTWTEGDVSYDQRQRFVYGRVVGDPFAEYNPTEPGRIVCRSRPACLSRRVATARSARRALPLLCASTSPGGVYGAYEGDRKNPIPTGGIVNPRPKE